VPSGSPPSSADVVEWVAWAGLVADGDPDQVARADVVVRVPSPAATVQADLTGDGQTFSGPPPQLIATCGSGVSATVALLALERIGVHADGVYDGSFDEWSADPARRVAYGAAG
jgi:rhodanese-related sulfurtransferase